jgi:hypothetical protein
MLIIRWRRALTTSTFAIVVVRAARRIDLFDAGVPCHESSEPCYMLCFTPGQSRLRTVQSLAYAVLATLAVVADAEADAQESATVSVNCASLEGKRQHCAANTSAGVLMARSNGSGACLLGKTWGYDDAGVWVLDGCSADFIVTRSPGTVALAATARTVPIIDLTPAPDAPAAIAAPAAEAGAQTAESSATAASIVPPANETWGVYDPGKGFLIGRSDIGEASISAYTLVRYLNQMDDNKEFTDHLGQVRPVDGRNDIYSHRALVWLDGWVGDPKLRYTITWWTVNTTDQDALFGNLGYRFDPSFNLYAGVFGNPGSRSMQGSHPYWLGTDRVMADEFFRPFFAQGLYANGTVAPGVWYAATMGNSSSTLGSNASQLDRSFTYGGSVWWMPTTHEFGPRGGYGDWEYHESLATRFGFSAVYSPEDRYNDINESPDNTALRLADSLNVFETGSLVPGVTVTDVDYRILAFDAGMKYKGIFLQAEYFHRWLDSFKAEGQDDLFGNFPIREIKDQGFYVQAAFYPIPKVFETYTGTSQIYGDSSLGFGDSADYILGANYYPFNSRNYRLNLQYNYVDNSPVNSTFGYYVGGQKGNTISAAASVFF